MNFIIVAWEWISAAFVLVFANCFCTNNKKEYGEVQYACPSL